MTEKQVFFFGHYRAWWSLLEA